MRQLVLFTKVVSVCDGASVSSISLVGSSSNRQLWGCCRDATVTCVNHYAIRMELISHDEFSQLKLRQFCPPKVKIENLGEDNEYMGRNWYGEGIQGVDFLWRKKSGRQLDCILLALQPKFCPVEVEQAIFEAIHLP